MWWSRWMHSGLASKLRIIGFPALTSNLFLLCEQKGQVDGVADDFKDKRTGWTWWFRLRPSEQDQRNPSAFLLHQPLPSSDGIAEPTYMFSLKDQNTMAGGGRDEGWVHTMGNEFVDIFERTRPDKLIEYKAIGRFNDITASQFKQVLVDLDYRKTWDPHVCELNVISDEGSPDELIVWVHSFPTPLHRRIYLYRRTITVNEDKQAVRIVTRAVSPEESLSPQERDRFLKIVDKYKNAVLVDVYSSIVCIKSIPGEFGLTYTLQYCDDPKISIPSFARHWLSSNGIMDFLKRLHEAASALK